MFAAALIYSAKGVELSIYSTCKRISQKLLRNVQKFLTLIYEGLGIPPFKELRCNMEEIVLQGPDGAADVRIVNSYPSKVCIETCLNFIIYSLHKDTPSLKCCGPTILFLNRRERSPAFLKCSSR